MTIESIKTQEDLKAFLAEQSARLTGIEKAGWDARMRATGQPDHGRAYEAMGKLVKAMAKDDRAFLNDWKVQAQKADLGTPLYSDTATGSYLVPTELSNAIEYVAYQSSVFSSRVNHTPMKARQKIIPVADTMVSLGWLTAQSSALTEVNPTIAQKTLTAYTVGGWTGITESMMEDDATDLGRYLIETFGNYLGYELDYQITRGVTTPWDGILGTATYNVAMDISEEFTDIDWDDLVAMMAEITTERYRRGAVFAFHPTVVDALRSKKNANGDYILRENMALGSTPAFLGYPVLSCDALPGTTAAATKFGFFGNPRFFTLGDRVPMAVEKFDKTAYAVEYEQIFYRARGRYAGVVTVPAGFCTITSGA